MYRRMRSMGVVMGLGLAAGCGGVTVHEVSSTSPNALPVITVERLQACTDEFGGLLEPGQYNFHPVVEVDTDGINRGVEMVGIPKSVFIRKSRADPVQHALSGRSLSEKILTDFWTAPNLFQACAQFVRACGFGESATNFHPMLPVPS